ncbi:MAG: hypothetical protein ACOCXR_00770, partial [Phototrophicaceae bacterium]
TATASANSTRCADQPPPPPPPLTCPAGVSIADLPAQTEAGSGLIFARALIQAEFLDSVTSVVFNLWDLSSGQIIDSNTEGVAPYFFKGDNNGAPYGWDTSGLAGDFALVATVFVDGQECGTAEAGITVTAPPPPPPPPPPPGLHCEANTEQITLFDSLTKLRATSPTTVSASVNLAAPAGPDSYIIVVSAVGHPELGCPDSGHPWCNQTSQTQESLNVVANGGTIGNVPDHGTDRYDVFTFPLELPAGTNTIDFVHAFIGAPGIQSVQFSAALCHAPVEEPPQDQPREVPLNEEPPEEEPPQEQPPEDNTDQDDNDQTDNDQDDNDQTDNDQTDNDQTDNDQDDSEENNAGTDNSEQDDTEPDDSEEDANTEEEV